MPMGNVKKPRSSQSDKRAIRKTKATPRRKEFKSSTWYASATRSVAICEGTRRSGSDAAH
jgi:hypothetical protein